ncbi:Protein of unknown function [Cotesia congregata]|uniref:RNase H type-1 domain-containing protein n=1 Tax=Cotesia congregata TaxID=51543 RepID=A0A8J2HQJ4_COTCN|nr:Protein of unknown function [Cotesia congregata]
MEDGASNDLLIPEDLPMTPKTTKFQTSPSLPKNSEIPTAPNQEKTMLPPLTPMQQKSLVSISKNQTAMETKERTKALKRTHSLTTKTEKAIEIDSDRESENSYAASELEDNILNIDSQEPRVVKKKIKTDDRTDDQVWQDLENEFKEEQNFPMTIIQFKNLKDSAKGKHDVTEIVAEAFKESRRTSWENFVSSINPNTPIDTMWKKIKAISGKNNHKLEIKKFLPQPLRIRANKYLMEFSLPQTDWTPRNVMALPPWEELILPINLDLAENTRKTTSTIIYQNLFLELKEKYSGYRGYYTDSSCVDGRSSCAIINDNDPVTIRLEDYCSIFTCEATAILKTLHIINSPNKINKFVIFSDSLSTLTAFMKAVLIWCYLKS